MTTQNWILAAVAAGLALNAAGLIVSVYLRARAPREQFRSELVDAAFDKNLSVAIADGKYFVYLYQRPEDGGTRCLAVERRWELALQVALGNLDKGVFVTMPEGEPTAQ